MNPEDNNNPIPEQPPAIPEPAPMEPESITTNPQPTETPLVVGDQPQFAASPTSPVVSPDVSFVPPVSVPVQPVQPISPPAVMSSSVQQDKKKLYMIIGIVAAALVVVIIAVVLALTLSGNKNGAQTKGGGSSNNSSISSVKDVKTLDDAVAYAKNVSKYKNPVLSDFQFMDNGTTKTYRVSVIDIDGYKKDAKSDFYYYPEKKVDFDTKGTQNNEDSKMSVYSPEYKKYYGYGGRRSIDKVLEEAKSKLTLSGTQLGKTYLFEFKDSTFDADSDSWDLMWAKSGQDEKSGELKATAVELKDSDYSVVRTGDASLYIW